MTPAQLNRSLQSVGMKCFVSYFEEFSDPFLSNGAVSEILVEREFYTEKAGRSRTSTARRIIKEGYARDSLLMVASAKKVEPWVTEKARNLLEAFGPLPSARVIG